MNKFNILVVEDNLNNVEILREITNNVKNCVSFFASRGDKALKFLMEEDINLIFLDLGLPDIEGYELLKIIKDRKKTSVIPVIVITGLYMTDEDKRKGFEMGASDYILKPYSQQEITNKIYQYMSTFVKIQDLIKEIVDKNKKLQTQNQSLKKAFNKIEHLIIHDGLTNLYNRYYLDKYIAEKTISLELPFSVIMMDMNNMKMVNDTYGHSRGDEIIIKAANYLTKFTKDDNTLIRWSGDEFVLILPKTDSNKSQEYVSEIMQRNFELSDFSVSLNLSAGTCTVEKDELSMAEIIKIAEDRMYRNKFVNAKSYRSSVIESLKKILFEKDFETEKHTKRVAEITMEMAKGMNMSIAEKDEIYLLATLHDIGKIAIPESILMKPGKLNKEEWELIKKHPEVGNNICKTIPELISIADNILCHHEWWNGEGYPRNLKENEIPILSRILTIADAYDVMTTGRPYKKAISREEAKKELSLWAGIQFDPKLVEIFIKCCS